MKQATCAAIDIALPTLITQTEEKTAKLIVIQHHAFESDRAPAVISSHGQHPQSVFHHRQ